MDNKKLHQHCVDWAHWCYTRKFYVTPAAKNILARMQPSKVGQPPDARNDPDMQFFNMAIHTLAAMQEHQDTFVCFSLCYIEQRANIKREAANLNICRRTYYNRVNAFARRALSMSASLKAAHGAMMGREKVGECEAVD
jgi:hypothetical protein